MSLLLLASATQCGALVAHSTPCALRASLCHSTMSLLASHASIRMQSDPDEQPASALELEPSEKPADNAADAMGPMDYARFFGTIAGFLVFFFAVAAVLPAGAAQPALTPMDIHNPASARYKHAGCIGDTATQTVRVPDL